MTKHDDHTEQALASLNKRWMHAYTTGDIEFLEQHMSQDYVGTFPDGSVHNKKSEVEGLKSGAVKIEEMWPKEMAVRVYDHAAVLTGRSHIRANVGGRSLSADFRFTDVWIERNGQWQAVPSQVTRIEVNEGRSSRFLRLPVFSMKGPPSG